MTRLSKDVFVGENIKSAKVSMSSIASARNGALYAANSLGLCCRRRSTAVNELLLSGEAAWPGAMGGLPLDPKLPPLLLLVTVMMAAAAVAVVVVSSWDDEVD